MTQPPPRDTSYKCEFCDIVLRSDLDTSKHLTSEIHVKNKNAFIALQNVHDKYVDKNTPKSISQVFKALHLRNTKDLDSLAEKGYFEIDSEQLAEIAEELAKTLVKSIIDHESKVFPQDTRARILRAFSDSDKQKSTATNSATTPPKSGVSRGAVRGEPPAQREVPVPTSNNAVTNGNPQPTTSGTSGPVSLTPATSSEPVKAAQTANRLGPKMNSEYVIKLAKIKVEPRD